MRRLYRRLNVSRMVILSFLVFLIGNSAWANPVVLEPTIVSKSLVLVFVIWTAMGILHSLFTRKTRHWPMIFFLLLLIMFFLAFEFALLIWSFYITWVLIFLSFLPFKITKREKMMEIIRHGISLAILLSIGTYNIIHERLLFPKLYAYSHSSISLYYIASFLALGFSLYLILKFSNPLDFSKSLKIKFLCVVLIGFILPPILYSKIISPGFERHPNISRIKADQRSLATGLEAYFLDHNSYPNYAVGGPHSVYRIFPKYKAIFDRIPTFETADGRSLHTLTTPVAYITAYFDDSFSVKYAPYAYYCVNDRNGVSGWIVWSPGPDGVYDLDIDAVKKYYDPRIPQPSAELLSLFTYDPTNGYYSRGDVYRVMQ